MDSRKVTNYLLLVIAFNLTYQTLRTIERKEETKPNKEINPFTGKPKTTKPNPFLSGPIKSKRDTIPVYFIEPMPVYITDKAGRHVVEIDRRTKGLHVRTK